MLSSSPKTYSSLENRSLNWVQFCSITICFSLRSSPEKWENKIILSKTVIVRRNSLKNDPKPSKIAKNPHKLPNLVAFSKIVKKPRRFFEKFQKLAKILCTTKSVFDCNYFIENLVTPLKLPKSGEKPTKLEQSHLKLAKILPPEVYLTIILILASLFHWKSGNPSQKLPKKGKISQEFTKLAQNCRK